jgi:branched-chain amino acid transport system ATP-binding protein
LEVPADRPLLATHNVVVRFGGLTALDDVNLQAADGQITGLIGPNGAGKTTLFNVLTGVLQPTRGRVEIGGTDVTRWPAHRRARFGVARTFQSLQLFTGLTVYDNLLSAWEASVPGGVLGRNGREGRRRVDEMIDLLRLGAVAGRPAGQLPTGLGRLIELGRALVTRPRLLLLDEPSSGLDAVETAQFKELLLTVIGQGSLGILLVEHDMALVMDLCDWISVLDFGKLIASGTPADIRANESVIAAYLGDVSGDPSSSASSSSASGVVSA